jgi:hypothetical protein
LENELDIIEDRIKAYHEEHCWQYEIRKKNYQEDLEIAGLSEEEVSTLRISDFEFTAYDETTKKLIWKDAKAFIERHEWLGKMSLYPTHIFTATYKGILAGIVIMDMPNSFSKLLGEGTRKIERLISRGACVSWSPKNLASSLIMFGIHWAVKNTRFRVFTAYSDSEAKEIGTIYQACNFTYLGKSSGTKKQYKVKGTQNWISDRSFRARSFYRRYAKNLGIVWNPDWQSGDTIIWSQMPADIAQKLKDEAKKALAESEVREVAPKHKYMYILGRDKKETKELKRRFREASPSMVGLSYPKVRGE